METNRDGKGKYGVKGEWPEECCPLPFRESINKIRSRRLKAGKESVEGTEKTGKVKKPENRKERGRNPLLRSRKRTEVVLQ